MKSFDTAVKNIRRSPYQSVAAILIMFLTFLLAGIFSLTTLASAAVLDFFEGKPQITVFFTDEIQDSEVESLKSTLNNTGLVESLAYVSKDDALEIYREQNKDDPLLLEMVTAEILPASLEVSAVDPKFLVDLEDIIGDTEGIEEVVYQKDVVDSLITWTNAIRLVGGVIAGLLASVSVFTIMTIISMKLAIKKDEIEILDLIGASGWYIRLPLLIEGAVYGLIGSFVAGLLIIGLVLWTRPTVLSFLGSIPPLSSILSNPLSAPFLLSISGFVLFLMMLGVLLGAFGSFVAINRYLKLGMSK